MPTTTDPTDENYEVKDSYIVERLWYDHDHGLVNAQIDAQKQNLTDGIDELHVSPDVPCYVTVDGDLATVEPTDGVQLRLVVTDELPQQQYSRRTGVRVLPVGEHAAD